MNNQKVISISGVDCYEKDGTAYLKLENVARGLGFTQIAASGNEVVRWERVKKYLSELSIPTSGDGAELPDFIPENIFYRLAMKAKNETEEKFQAKEMAMLEHNEKGTVRNVNANNLVHIGNSDISVKEYDGRRVVTFKDIDMVHGRPEGTARKRFNNNKKRFIDGTDFFVRKTDEAQKEFGISAPNGLTLVTESGYLMLVKSFTDDLAWEVQRQLVDNYFRVRQPVDDIVLKYIDRQQHFMEKQEQFNQMVLDKLEGLNGDRVRRFVSDANGSFLRHINHEFDFDEKAIIEENKKELCKLTAKVAGLCGVSHNSILHQIYKALEKKLGIELDAYRSVYRSETGNQSAGMIEVISAHTWIFENAIDLCEYVIEKKNVFD